MSFMKKMLSSVGIGSAKVDTVLDHNEFVPGEVMSGVVQLKGGSIAQSIDEIYFSIHCNYEGEYRSGDGETKSTTKVAVLDKFCLGESISLSPGEVMEIPIELELPYDTPLTYGKTQVWVQTGLDIKNAIDPSDRDYVSIVPDHLSHALFSSLRELGLDMVDAECEEVRSYSNRLPFIQEFEFKARSGPFYRRIDEIEIICFPDGNHLEVLMEVDRKARGFTGFLAEALDRDEVNVRFNVSEANLHSLTEEIHNLIDRYC